jgi:hypothetical protein
MSNHKGIHMINNIKIGGEYRYRTDSLDFKFSIFGMNKKDGDVSYNILILENQPYLYNVSKKELENNLKNNNLRRIK